MKLSVIVPCLNAADVLGVQLEALAGQRWDQPWEVIVSDNGSTDRSLAIVDQYKARIPNLRVADASARKGQPYALNVGAMAATGDALAFCDADDEVAPGWLAAVAEALSKKYDFVACRIDMEKLNPTWLPAGFKKHPQNHGLQKASYPPYLPHGGGGTLGVKKSLHDRIGGFDESLPYLHDTDYCFKIQLTGTKLHFLPDAVVNVRHRNSATGVFRQARNYAEYRVLLYKRYRPSNDKELWRWKIHLNQWKTILRSISQIRYKTSRFAWAWSLGYQVGMLKGSIKHGVPPVE